MRRRDFLLAVIAAWPFGAWPRERIPRIGYLGPEPIDTDVQYFEAFQAAMRDLGYVEGQTVEIVARFPKRIGESMPQLARELVDLKVDVIVSGTMGVYAAHEVTKTVPIVARIAGDLVEIGLADSLGHPGGNVTGQTFLGPQLMVKRAEMLKRVKPSLKRIGLLLLRGALSGPSYARALMSTAKSMNLDVEVIELSDASECETALASRPGAVDGLVVVEYSQFITPSGAATIASIAARRGLPSIGAPSFAKNGGLMDYGVDFTTFFPHAAVFVDKILKGSKPGDIPIEQPTKFTMIVNLKTASALGLEIPPDILAAADEVIE